MPRQYRFSKICTVVAFRGPLKCFVRHPICSGKSATDRLGGCSGRQLRFGKILCVAEKAHHVRKRRTLRENMCGKSAPCAEKAHIAHQSPSRKMGKQTDRNAKTANFEGGYLARRACCGSPLRVGILEIWCRTRQERSLFWWASGCNILHRFQFWGKA